MGENMCLLECGIKIIVILFSAHNNLFFQVNSYTCMLMLLQMCLIVL